MVLLDASYETRDETAVIVLYESGGSTKDVDDFRPYFYLIPEDDADKLVREINSNAAYTDYVTDVEKVKRGIGPRNYDEKDVVLLHVSHPQVVPKLRDSVLNLEHCAGIREADIRFVQRYLIDSGLVPLDGVEKADLNIAAFDIETYSKGAPNPQQDPVLMISYADSLGLEKVWTYKESKHSFVETFKNEEEMLKAFIETVKKQNIDIILSYNGDNFDFGYVKERCDVYGLRFDIGVKGREVVLERRGMNMGARVVGRPHVDLYPICRRLFNLPKYTLEDVYLSIFNEEKVDINKDQITTYWDNGGKDLDTLIEYSLSDVKATYKIGIEVLPLQYQLTQLIGQPIYEVSRMSSGNMVEWLLMNKAYNSKVLIPNRPEDSEVRDRGMNRYEGGYVLEPKKGIHDNIIVLDFRSLYPSIIIAHNVDPSTLNCDCCDDGHVSPTNAKFCKKRKGFISEILRDIIETRTKLKKELKEEKNETKRKMLDSRQHALKILANSFYGYMGFARARWYSRECAESVTAWGREYIKKTMAAAEKEGWEVVYGDTDSLFMKYQKEAEKKEIVDKGKDFLKKINSDLPEAMELEYEGFYQRGVFITKKRYALMDENEKLIIKGLETRRRDWANVAKTTQQKVLHKILWEKDPTGAAAVVKEMINELKGGKVPLKELTINTQLTRSIGSYQNIGPHVMAVKKAMKEGMNFGIGDIVSYIETKKGDSITDKAKVVQLVDEGDYDADYYINNQVLPAVMRILEALGYTEDELKGLGKQMNLGSW